MILTITIDRLAPGPNGPKGLHRMHWATKKHHRDVWTALIRSARPANWKPVTGHVKITRQSYQEMDPDNLKAACKIPLDALTRAGVIVDDSPKHITLEAVWQRGPSQTIIEVTDQS